MAPGSRRRGTHPEPTTLPCWGSAGTKPTHSPSTRSMVRVLMIAVRRPTCRIQYIMASTRPAEPASRSYPDLSPIILPIILYISHVLYHCRYIIPSPSPTNPIYFLIYIYYLLVTSCAHDTGLGFNYINCQILSRIIITSRARQAQRVRPSREQELPDTEAAQAQSEPARHTSASKGQC